CSPRRHAPFPTALVGPGRLVAAPAPGWFPPPGLLPVHLAHPPPLWPERDETAIVPLESGLGRWCGSDLTPRSAARARSCRLASRPSDTALLVGFRSSATCEDAGPHSTWTPSR